MSKILDRLLARQRRLLDQLDNRQESAAAVLTSLSPAELQERAVAEAIALERADASLLEGDAAAAKAALAPFEQVDRKSVV